MAETVQAVTQQAQTGEIAPEPAALVPAEPLGKPKAHETPDEKVARRFRDMENSLLERAMGTLDDVLCAREIDDGQTEVPQRWIKELGSMEKASERLRVARDARHSAKTAPVYLAHANNIASAIIKARATEKSQAGVTIIVNVHKPERRDYGEPIDVEPVEGK